jgi:uncharacterized protein YdaU (DUF1376 family)
MPLYVRDYIADTVHLSTLEHGAYFMLIMHYWLHGGLPSDEAKLARIARLSFEQWNEVRPTLIELFNPEWRHKRIESELATTREKYERRAEAGRRGGIASAKVKKCSTVAEEMLSSEQSNAAAGLNQPQPQPQPHRDKSQSGADASDEDRFWSRLDCLRAKGIGRSRCTQLLKLIDSDFIEANRVLDATEAAKKPGQYLGAVIRNLERGANAAPLGANSNVPDWVNAKRAAGVLVNREGQHWRCLGELHNDAGEAVGW